MLMDVYTSAHKGFQTLTGTHKWRSQAPTSAYEAFLHIESARKGDTYLAGFVRLWDLVITGELQRLC